MPTYGTATGIMKMERLRSPDASYLSGATLPVLGSYPIAVCRPSQVVPNLVAVVADDFWVTDYVVPAANDILWVMVQAQLILQTDGTPGVPQWGGVFSRGLYTDGDAARGPVWGNAAWTEVQVANAGTYQKRVVPTYPDSHYPANSYWLPLDPASTRDGFNVTTVIRAHATTGAAISEWAQDARGVLLVGYPSNLWGTGALWAPVSQRGV